MIMLLVLTLLGVTAMNTTSMQERMAAKIAAQQAMQGTSSPAASPEPSSEKKMTIVDLSESRNKLTQNMYII